MENNKPTLWQRELNMWIWSVPNGIKRGDLLERLYGWKHYPVRFREGPTRRQLKPSPGHTLSRSSFRDGLAAQRERAVGEVLLKSKAVRPGPHSPAGRLPIARLVHNIQGCRGKKKTSLHFWLCWLQEVGLTSFSTGTMKRQPISKGSKDGKSETLTHMCWGQRAALLFKYFCKWHKPSKRLVTQSQVALKLICHTL